MPFDPLWLTLAGFVLFSLWMAYEHRRTSDALGQCDLNFNWSQAADKDIASLLNQHNAADPLNNHLVPEHKHPYALVHEHPYAPAADYAPLAHDHTGGDPGHVHWLKYNSTEVTDTQRRDVYLCLVPDCKAIFAHTPN